MTSSSPTGYYVHLWAQVLEADAFVAFQESGDVFNPEIAAKLRKLMAAGGSLEEMKQYLRVPRP